MTEWQKLVKAFAIVLAVILIVGIIAGIVSGISVLGFVFSPQSHDTTVSEHVLSEQPLSDIHELEVELANYALIIEQGDILSVAYDDRNKQVTVEDNKLIITEKKKLFYGQEGYVVILTVPKNYFFTNVSITMGAGSLDIKQLSTNVLDLELGAGDVDIENLTAITSVDIDGGAGDLSILDSEITDLDLDMGVGALTLSTDLIGNNQIDLGVGDSDIKLKGTADDYRFDIQKGIGEITFDGEKFNDDSEDVTMHHDNISNLEINCGIGKVNIDFMQ